MSLRSEFLPSTTKLLRLCSYRRLSVHGGGVGGVGVSASVHAGIPHPPGSRHPPWSTHPPEQTPRSRHTPGSRHCPGADTLQSRHPQSRHPLEQTPPRSRRHPLEQTPPGADIPPLEQTPPRADTPGADTPPEKKTPPGADTPSEQNPTPPMRPLLRTVRILLECILVVQIFHLFPITSDADCCRTICISWPFPQKF